MTEINELDFSDSEGAIAGAEHAAASASGGGFNRLDFFGLDGSTSAIQSGTNSAIVRFLSDISTINDPDGTSLSGYISVLQHSSVQTKAKPANHEGNWPKSMSATCRKDRIFAKKYDSTCYICDAELINTNNGKASRATDRKWALAVLREEVLGDGTEALGGEEYKGKIVGVRDKMKEVAIVKDGEATGQTEFVKAYVKINLGWSNFFQPLSAIGARFGTLLDRDYYIARSGEGTDTSYAIIPNDPINWSKDPSRVFDLRDPEIRKASYPDMPDLRQVVADTASDDLYNRVFIPEADQKPGATPEPQAKPATAAQQKAEETAPAQPSGDEATPDGDRMAAIKARLQSSGGGGISL